MEFEKLRVQFWTDGRKRERESGIPVSKLLVPVPPGRNGFSRLKFLIIMLTLLNAFLGFLVNEN